MFIELQGNQIIIDFTMLLNVFCSTKHNDSWFLKVISVWLELEPWALRSWQPVKNHKRCWCYEEWNGEKARMMVTLFEYFTPGVIVTLFVPRFILQNLESFLTLIWPCLEHNKCWLGSANWERRKKRFEFLSQFLPSLPFLIQSRHHGSTCQANQTFIKN